jgi:hypothetical protein
MPTLIRDIRDKYAALTLALALILTLAACGGDVSEPTKEPAKTSSDITDDASTQQPLIENGRLVGELDFETAKKYSNMAQIFDGGLVFGLTSDGVLKVASPDGDNAADFFGTGFKNFPAITQYTFFDDDYFIGLKTDGTVFSYTGDDDTDLDSIKLKEQLFEWRDIVDICALDGLGCLAGLTAGGIILLAGIDDGYLANGDILIAKFWTDVVGISTDDDGGILVAVKKDGTVAVGGVDDDVADLVADWTDIVDAAEGSNETIYGLKKDGTLELGVEEDEDFASMQLVTYGREAAIKNENLGCGLQGQPTLDCNDFLCNRKNSSCLYLK